MAFANSVRVSAFGAFGNGIADDTAAITNALAAAGVGGVLSGQNGIRNFKVFEGYWLLV